MEGNLNLEKKISEQEPADYVNLDEEPFAELPTDEQPNPEAPKQEGEAAGAIKTPVEPETEEDRDAKSVFVKNVNYNAEKKEIEEHFADCGEIKLITIL